jgi:hypothetical protein
MRLRASATAYPFRLELLRDARHRASASPETTPEALREKLITDVRIHQTGNLQPNCQRAPDLRLDCCGLTTTASSRASRRRAHFGVRTLGPSAALSSARGRHRPCASEVSPAPALAAAPRSFDERQRDDDRYLRHRVNDTGFASHETSFADEERTLWRAHRLTR